MGSKKAKKRRQRQVEVPGESARAAFAPVPASASRADDTAGAPSAANGRGVGGADASGGKVQPQGMLDRLAASTFGAGKPRSGEPASMGRRFLAYLIDWYAGALVTNIPISIAAGSLTGSMLNQKLADLGPFWLVAGAGAVLMGIVYYVAIPAFLWKGQTPAKRLLGLRIDGLDGEPAGLRQLLPRQVVGIMVLEGVLVTASSDWHQMLAIATGIDFTTYLMYAGYAVAAISIGMLLLSKDHRCLHDVIGGTRVNAA